MTIVNSCNSVNAFELDNSTCPELKCREYKFTQKDKIIIGCAFLSKTCTAADPAAQYNCHISYIYRLAELANTFLDAYLTEEDDEGEKVYGLIPLTKSFIKVSAVALRTICQASLEDTSIFIREIYGYHICTSTISNICSEAAVRADEFNRSVLLSNVCVGANDEIFFVEPLQFFPLFIRSLVFMDEEDIAFLV